MELKPVAAIRNVSVNFATPQGTSKPVLRDVTLSAAPGELLVVIGRSGCGKTTVLNLFAGLVLPSSGEVEVLGSSPAQARTRLSYMFARDALLPWRTAARNVDLALQVRGIARTVRRKHASEMLALVGLKQYESYYIWQLSQGMRQRVALARTWVGSPELLLLDEPFAALDAQTRLSIHAVFLELWARDRRTVIFVTHDLHEAIVLADRIVVMGDGRILDDISVRFPRPRETTKLMEDKTYIQLVRRLHDLIEVGS
ncbi:MAG TPA: ABC transporter ATP-binding protein [Casimicrobiaceae bacterium]|nr:ABC transporter ATP-binding protein [Casimicrobiaceae bacterium]